MDEWVGERTDPDAARAVTRRLSNHQGIYMQKASLMLLLDSLQLVSDPDAEAAQLESVSCEDRPPRDR